MITINIIAAKTINNIIGSNNKLPWYLPDDLKNFRKLTENKIVIMGRKTYESIGKPLPNRINIVVSSNTELSLPKNVHLSLTAKDSCKLARKLSIQNNINEIYVIGGAKLYQAFIKRADKILLTVIQKECDGDTFFPSFKEILWKKINTNNFFDPKGYLLDKPDCKGLQYAIEEYERIL